MSGDSALLARQVTEQSGAQRAVSTHVLLEESDLDPSPQFFE